jgi:hypothetical protein
MTENVLKFLGRLQRKFTTVISTIQSTPAKLATSTLIQEMEFVDLPPGKLKIVL